MPPSPGALVLNEPQRRHYAVLLAMLEEALAEVEAIAGGQAVAGRLRAVRRDLSRGVAAGLAPYVAQVRADVNSLAERLDVGVRPVSEARRLEALLLSCIVRLEDSTSDRLGGYGAVHASVARDVDPAVRRMHEALAAMVAVVAAARLP